MGMNIYRKTWIAHHGDIPKDEKGRSYHIHHIDRNRENNDISNLIALPIYDHYLEHLNAEEWRAAFAIAINLDEDEISYDELCELAKKAAKVEDPSKHHFNLPEIRAKNIESLRRRIEDGTFHLLSGEIQSKYQSKMASEGKHVFQQEKNKKIISETNKRRTADGTHPFVNKEIRQKFMEKQREKIAKGEYHTQSKEARERLTLRNRSLVAEGRHNFQIYETCNWCGEVGRGFGFISRHRDYCLENPRNKRMVCYWCGKQVHPSVFERYHGFKCKKYPRDK
jgi:intron-associated endonuclease 3|nr:MAG TPA: HNH endonuclease [Caudoviricetes sp.]